MTLTCAADLLAPSSLPVSMPDFDGATPQLCLEALREGMRLERTRWDEIAASPEAPTLANTLDALELAGAELERAEAVFFTLVSAVGGEEWDRAEADITADAVDHAHAFATHRGLYRRLLALRESVDAERDPEAAFVLDDYLASFRREGIDLDAAAHERLHDIDQRIGAIEQAFGKACVDARTAGAYRMTGVDALTPELAAAGATLVDGEVRVPLTNYTSHPLLASLASPTHRHGLMRASLARANGSGDVDTRGLVAELVTLRDERARLLGFDSFADYAVDDAVAPSADAVRDMLRDLARRTQRAVAGEEERLAELARAEEGEDYRLAAGDWTYFEEKLRAKTFTFSSEDLRPYLDLERVIVDGVFYAATRLYGITFTPRPDIRAWSEDVRAWEVHNEDGSLLGLFLGDYFTSEHKAGGAWMHELVGANGLTGDLPVVANTCNFTKPAPGEPALLSWDDVITCFHEFGHALHGLFAASRYPSHAGTSVPRDFVEFPSQLNEMWAYHPQVLARFLRHHETGLPAPREVVDEITASRTFGQGFATLEYLASALIDLDWHSHSASELPDAAGVEEFEAAAAERCGVAHPLIPPRYATTYFAHTFGGGYAAAYWSYMWAELMVADMENWISEGPSAGIDQGLNRAVGEALRHGVLAPGHSDDPLAAYRSVTGRDPDPAAVAHRRGLEGTRS
ncbi:M3 family metallopeptidase [Nanchangia anserum]|uniref:M3 family metallopeptidase n=1 Tax=Nanchangia anserum TaxID=2692125 RepID=A0A8I0KR41_9ACTO|nr:M3 family metallopeptidase [Nanchangia anserum]MBD3689062.1 M3 family metallopeptidase [Nanchangia anserum]QOX81303.1 M3 family metallopeptidase [Nanchangia anserum]